MQKLDYIIVGGGIAGVFCAYQLLKENKSFVVINSEKIPSSSKIAAGTWNPIAFKRFLLSWRAKEFLAEMEVQYLALETLLNDCFYEKIPSKKLVTEGDELNLWEQQAKDVELKNFMVQHPQKSTFPPGFYLGELKQTGRVNLKILLSKFHLYLQQKDAFVATRFDYKSLEKKSEYWLYNNYQTENVIFCEGSHYKNNPFFNWLPLKPAKGDIITIHAPELKLDYILKKNLFVLPLGNDCYEVGATYDWKNLSWETDEIAVEQLTEKLKKIISCPFKIIDKKAGIRPTSYDRRIIMGEHPYQKGLFAFNGLGTKGVLLAPLAAKEFCAFLLKKGVLNPEMDIKRCEKFYPANS